MRNFLNAVMLCVLAMPALSKTIDPADLEAFSDGVVNTAMSEDHVAGAVVGVVADGKVVLLKGYGYSDVDKKIPVDPQTTLFRPGSVTKLFTYISLMQLESEGKLNFDTDINQYMKDVQVPSTFPQPITLKDIMTHTAGFEDQVIGLFGRDEKSMKPLAEILRTEMPGRVRPPGQYASYSNHGIGMAGLIVQDVSGEPWAEYVDRHILLPLGMTHTSVQQPLPESLANDMSRGYVFQAGKYEEKPFEFVPLAPAGRASATGADMIRLVQAFLGGGADNGDRILSEAANREMQETLFRPAPDTNGIMHGLYETSSHGELIMGHGGDTLWFHSELMIMPDAGVGWFISTNTATGPKVVAAFHRQFLDRYFPVKPAVQETAGYDLSAFAGEYSAIRHSYDDFTKLIVLLGGVTVDVTPGGELRMSSGGEVHYLDPVGKAKFRVRDSGETVTFEMDDAGHATHLFLGSAPVVAIEKLTGTDAPSFHIMLISMCLVAFLWVLVIYTVQRSNRRYVLPVPVARFRLSAFLLAISVIAFILWFALAMGGPTDIVFGVGRALRWSMVMPWIIMALALITLALYLPLVREKEIGKSAKLGYLIVAAAGIAFTWLMFYWQLL